jgi:hypothetical protein
MGLEQYRKGNASVPAAGEGEHNLHDLIREYDKAIEQTDPYDEVMEPHEPRVRLVHTGELV